ncbi:winged helix-turn-helix domain-containing protein [Lysobacter enzymogenes]|uniref:Transcriptional regulator n=1 Tax=Lysobacter enzymogenes TaxID=69 RepID=A0AAU9ANG9_LYSEN|nr:winged helix-turn-helix domain-containing protein [Lysobacter enzymogenes]BAV98884.1 transcriptional regulator [Lysobacter enzymogenes]
MPQRVDRIKNLASVSQFRIGALLVQPDRLAIVRDGQSTALEPRMMEVLIALAERAGEVVSAEQLLIEIWRGTFYGDNPVHKTIAQLRRRLGDSSREPEFIETIRKRGYRLVAPVSFPDDYRSGLPRAAAWTQGSPYVGLRSFDQDHSGVFFGRSRATAELLATLREQIDNQRRFVLVAGASGCGKTSLLRAGVLPLLRQDGGFDGLHALASAYFDLGACRGGDLLARLAAALCAWSLDGRPVFLDGEAQWLEQQLRSAPEAVRARIDDAFARRTAPLAERAHLLLVVDHAEAAVAAPGIGDADRRDFGAALDALCSSPRVAAIAIARSDFYPALVEKVPGLAELKAGDGHIDLLTPRIGEIGQIIRAPAALAGLSFEEDPDSSLRLDDLLRDAAAEHPDSLPLLQHTLQALYERQGDGGLLRLATYRELGGLEGALAHRAEQVFAELPASAQASLERVLEALIVIRPDSDSVTGRRVPWSSLDGAAARELAEAFVRARLFVGELSGGEPGFGVAHEALLRQWPRAREWTRENRQLLQARERLQRAARRWAAEGRRNDHLLNPGRPLAEAREAARRLPDQLDADDLQFLHACERQQRRKQWLRAGAIGALCALALVATGLGLQAWQARREAEQRRDQAQTLVAFMLDDLAEQLRPLGNLKLLRSIANQSLSYLERMPETDMQPRELVSHARALRTVGEVLLDQGKFDDARVAFERAHAASARALDQEPQSLEALAESGTTAYWLGYHDYKQKKFDATRTHWQAYLHASERLVQRAPEDPRWRLELSYALNNLGTLAYSGQRLDEAGELFARSAAIKRQLLADKPDDSNLRYELVDSLSWLSSAQDARGLLAEAAQGYAAQTQMLRELVDSEPNADEWRRKLATSLLRSSVLALDRGQTEQAEREIAESVRMLKNLSEQQPDNQTWQRNLGHAYAHAGWVAAMAGARASALERLRAAQRTLAPIMQAKDRPPEWRLLDATVRLRLVQADPLASAEDADAAIADLQSLHEGAPADLPNRSSFARALAWRGERYAAAGETARARVDFQQVDRLLAQFAADTRDRVVLDAWSRAQVRLGARARAARQIAWLQRAGYRHPGFVALYETAPQPP